MLKQCRQPFDPFHNLVNQIFHHHHTRKRSINTKVIKGYTSFRKENDIHTAEYYFENGLRKVKPYNYHFKGYAKPRMHGSTVLDVFMKEYRGRSESYYRRAIEEGTIMLNEERTTADTLIKHHDLLCHTVHRHEPPVTAEPIDIVFEDEDLFVINKPGSIQVHPNGRYRHNTAVHILRKELNYDTLYPNNRLDRITSGLVLISKTAASAKRIGQEMRDGHIQKEYLCRVSGDFPAGLTVCEAPIKQLAYTVALNYVHSEGKPCTTYFERISYNGRTSLVRCRPITGRTHQIRVHLRFLGYPIANDPIYGYSTAWSSHMVAPLNTSEIVDDMIRLAPYDYMDDTLTDSAVKRCQVCHVPEPPQDPQVEHLSLWLHAYRYAGKKWAYTTKLPKWAQDDFVEEDIIIPAASF